MKKLLFLAVVLPLMILPLASSCGEWEDLFPDEETENDDTVPILDGNTLTYGDHHYTFEEDATAASLVFTHFPATMREFETLQNQLLGESRPGALALELMAFEMYRRNRTKGKHCIELCTVSAEARLTFDRLNQKFPADRYDEVTDTYQQPYLVASFLKGANVLNGYQPDYPYQFEFKLNDNPNVKQGERTTFGYIYHYLTNRNGKMSNDAAVLVPHSDPVVLVNGCSNYTMSSESLYTPWKDTLK